MASAVAFMATVAGCDDDCSLTKTFEQPGAKMTGPSTVKPGETAEYTVSGTLGKNKDCPVALQLAYEELDAKGKPLKGPLASRGKATEIRPLTKTQLRKTKNGCTVRPQKMRIVISPGRTDEHKVRVTGTIAQLKPSSSDKDFDGIIKWLLSAPVRQDVTVEGAPKPPPSNPTPGALFDISQNPAIQGQPLGLDASRSLNAKVPIANYEWDLDGNGSFEKSSTSPTGVQVDSVVASGPQLVRLRTTTPGGASITSEQFSFPTVAAGTAYQDGTPTLTPERTGPNKPITVGVKTTTPSAAGTADLFCGENASSSLTNPTTGQSFSSRCQYSTTGFRAIAVRYTQPDFSSGPEYAPTVFYRVVDIASGARASRVAQKATPLAVPLSLSGAKVKSPGKLRLTGSRGTVRGLILTGTGRGRIPKGTPKRFRSALSTLASGRFAARLDGSGQMFAGQLSGRGSATMLVRSRKSRRTQMCVRIRGTGTGGQSRFTVLGATGAARGFRATGTGPALSLDGTTSDNTTVSLTPSRGKARGLNRTCRSLVKVLRSRSRK